MVNQNSAKREADKFRLYLELITQGRPRDWARKTTGLTHVAVHKYTLAFLKELQEAQNEETEEQPGATTGEQLPTP